MPRLLVYTRTTGYRHESIPAGVRALAGLDGFGGGRCLYTALGHTTESFSEPAFVSHLRGALEWLTE
jgi:hypothetical protein